MDRMKKAPPIAAGLLLILAAAAPAGAQTARSVRPLGVYLDIAYVNLSEPPRWMALGPELEWRIGRTVSFNPEVLMWVPDTFRGTIEIVPGLTANLRFNRLFVGGGFVGGVDAWTLDGSGWLIPKLQMGYLMGPAKLALTVFVPGGPRSVAVGLTIGTRIGRPGFREPD